MATARTPRRTRKPLPGISSRAWEHPADRTALTALRSLSGFDAVLKTLSGLLRERQHRLLFLASAVRVDRRQFSDLEDLYLDALHILDSPTRPELYVVQDPAAKAFTMGMDSPFIVLSTGMVELMAPEELRFVLGHEIGHALSGHSVYRTMTDHLIRLVGTLGWLPMSAWGLRALVAGLLEWSRKAELSGDRAGLLAVQDEVAALRVMMKLAGGHQLAKMDTDAFLEQAAEYEATGDLRDGVLKLLNLELRSHPFSVMRAAELQKWASGNEYRAILAGDYPRREDDKKARIRDEVKGAASSYKDGFDTSTDPLISTLRNLGADVGSAAGAVSSNVADVVSGIWARFDPRRGNRPNDGGDAPKDGSA